MFIILSTRAEYEDVSYRLKPVQPEEHLLRLLSRDNVPAAKSPLPLIIANLLLVKGRTIDLVNCGADVSNVSC